MKKTMTFSALIATRVKAFLLDNKRSINENTFSDVIRRVIEHNTKPFGTFISKHKPWILKAAFQ